MSGPFVYDLPAVVLCDFCWVMDALSDLDWNRFASAVLGDQTTVQLAQKKENRTAWVMNQWGSRKGQISELVDLLGGLSLFRPRDIILTWVAGWKAPSPAPRPPPAPVAAQPAVPDSLAHLAPPSKPSGSLPMSHTCLLTPQNDAGGAKPLPRPDPPPSSLQSNRQLPPQPLPPEAALRDSGGDRSVMCWSYDEVHAGTEGFSPSLKVGEGGFGVVYRASLKNTDCAVKRLKQDCLLDWEQLKESFQTEVDKLSKFRHPNIVDLLGFSEGPGSVCLIYTYMDNRSLEDQLHSEGSLLSWSQRVNVVKEASTALQFLHCPPGGHTALIHGDVKSSNILLDRHMTAKLADFGLARFAPRGSPTQTTTVGHTATIRGTQAYLPEEYTRGGKLSTAVDVFSFGVVLLEVLTGRRAVQSDRSGDTYLKDMVDEVEEEEDWRKQLDRRLVTENSMVPPRSMEVAALACRCLDRIRKRRPAMTEVFERLREFDSNVGGAASSHQDSSLLLLSHGLSKLGPLEDVYCPSRISSSSSSSATCSPPSSSSSSSSSSLSSRHSLRSSSLPLSPSPSSLSGPCETDESRGYSQYDLSCQLRVDRTSNPSCSSQSAGDHQRRVTPVDSHFSQPSVPIEDQYNFPAQAGSSSSSRSGGGANAGTSPESCSPVRSLKSLFPAPTVVINPSKRHFLQKKALYEEGQIETPELLSSNDLYCEQTCDNSRGPVESDELEFLPAKGH